MKSILAATAGLAAISTVSAAALEKRQSLTDADILNFALTLEHLEDTFYRDALTKFDAAAFTQAGYDASVRDRISQIAADEASHVSFLTAGLQAAGATPVQACKYNFPYTDVKSFLALSQVLEGVGVSAYLGAAASIQNGAYLTAAGSILTVEARHNAYVRFLNGESPFPAAFDTPTAPGAVVTLATPFFASCPEGSAPGLKGFPAVNVTGAATPGNALTITAANATGATVCTFLSGLNSTNTAYANNTCKIPADGSVGNGQVYVFLQSANATNVSDATVVAGPGILDIGAGSAGNSSAKSASNGSIGASPSGSGSSSGSGPTSGAAVMVAGGTVASVMAGLVALFA